MVHAERKELKEGHMALTDNKITTWTNPIVNEADRPQRSAADMKAIFDSNSNQLKKALNDLIDALGQSGGGDIGASVEGMAGNNVQALIAELKGLIDAIEEYTDSLKTPNGAANVGAEVSGIAGDNIAAVLTALKTLCDRVVTVGDGDVFLANDGTYKLPQVGASANGVVAGGAAGNVYIKKSAKVYDAEWKTPQNAFGGIFAAKDHNHDTAYSAINHNHDDRYAQKNAAKTASLPVLEWTGEAAPFAQTITVQGMTAASNIIVAPAPASLDAYGSAQVRCAAQAANSLTFTCEKAPETNLTVNILIVG